MIVVALLSCYVFALVWRVIINSSYLQFTSDSMEWEMKSALEFFGNAMHSTYLLLCWTGIYFGIKYYESLQQQREATLRAATLAQEAQLKMLRYQLNPHFLFNTLNAISTLILDNENRTANQTVMRLSEFLRYTLDQDPMKKVTLRQEIEAMNLYLTTEKLRFGERLRLEFAIEERALEALVPSLLLQPLIENAVKYAVSPSEQGGTIRVEGRARGAMLELAVADDGPGSSTRGRGSRRGPRRRACAIPASGWRCCTRIAIDSRPWTTSPDCASSSGCRWKWRRPRRMNTPRKLRTLLVDDEALSRRGLELRLRVANDIEIIGECSNGREALEAIREHRPDLVFLDIQMPGLSGFDVLAELQPHELPMIVFVTAYDRFAVQAFEARAIDYVLKPVDDARLAATLTHVRELTEQRTAVAERNQLVNLLAELRGSGEIGPSEPAGGADRPPNWLPIRNGRETVRVPVQAIEWVDAAGDYLCIHADGHTHILRATMREMENLLDPRLFQRVHRSTIVNLTRVKSLRAHMNGEYFLRLEGGQELKLSRTYRDKVEYFLKRPRAH